MSDKPQEESAMSDESVLSDEEVAEATGGSDLGENWWARRRPPRPQ